MHIWKYSTDFKNALSIIGVNSLFSFTFSVALPLTADDQMWANGGQRPRARPVDASRMTNHMDRHIQQTNDRLACIKQVSMKQINAFLSPPLEKKHHIMFHPVFHQL